MPPSIQFPDIDEYYLEAKHYVEKQFPKHLGSITEYSLYPTSFEASKLWLNQFFEQRFMEFGIYEDAIVAEHSILNHSVLTPMLNVGLITPKAIVDACLIAKNALRTFGNLIKKFLLLFIMVPQVFYLLTKPSKKYYKLAIVIILSASWY